VSDLQSVSDLLRNPLPVEHGVHLAKAAVSQDYLVNTTSAFSDKWTSLDQDPTDTEGWKQAQFRWYLDCYGYASEEELADSLSGFSTILDAGCGPGHKAAWLARLCPEATVVAMDLSDSVFLAARRYADRTNMRFIHGDIASTPFRDSTFDFVNCDQVLHHTEDPPRTLQEFRRIVRAGGVLHTYVYARKALPRELLDDHFRKHSSDLSREQLWALSEQLTQLGKTLSDLNVTIDVPDIPELGIIGGRMDLQRFVYWNFLKCFWNPEHGLDGSRMVNFDWYSPGTAFRYSREEFVEMVSSAGFAPLFLHSEEACHSGRFVG